MLDPVALAEETRRIVARKKNGTWQRKYYRFRPAHFYGGIATADCVGCNLRCLFCWAWNVVTRPDKAGQFYSPEEVAEKLITIAREHGFKKVRISGNEPTLVKEHLLAVLKHIPEDILFILETNGIMIGHDKGYAKGLAEASKKGNFHVRVCLKGSSHEEFGRLTGAVPEAYELQFKALERLKEAGVGFHPAIMTFSADHSYVEKRLEAINPALVSELEYEELVPYPAIVGRMRAAGFEVQEKV